MKRKSRGQISLEALGLSVEHSQEAKGPKIPNYDNTISTTYKNQFENAVPNIDVHGDQNNTTGSNNNADEDSSLLQRFPESGMTTETDLLRKFKHFNLTLAKMKSKSILPTWPRIQEAIQQLSNERLLVKQTSIIILTRWLKEPDSICHSCAHHHKIFLS